tara:strand:- start:8991 stop:9302 length:312 start_codon:yes stop_codon:yes gene_type:complete
MKKYPLLALLTLLALTPQAHSQEDSKQEPIRASEYQRSDQGPAIVIRNDQDNTYYEYRVNGEIQEIKVEPGVGPAYYLVPVEGGYIRRDESGLRLPSWVLFRW